MTEQTTNIPKMRFKLGELNELKFMLSIKGSTSDQAAAQPKIRFLVTEAKTGMAMCFPMEKLEEGVVGVNIPALVGVFQEGADYTGQVEVIVGNRWFNPTTIGLVFEREMKVEAVPILTEENQKKIMVEELQENLKPEQEDDGFSGVIRSEAQASELTKPKFQVNQEALGVLFSEPKLHRSKSTAPNSNAKSLSKKPSSSLSSFGNQQQLKNRLKSMIFEACSELEE